MDVQRVTPSVKYKFRITQALITTEATPTPTTTTTTEATATTATSIWNHPISRV